MPPPEALTRDTAAPVTSRRLWRGQAFGVEVVSERPIPGLAPSGPRSAVRQVVWRQLPGTSLAALVRTGDRERVVDLRHPDGRTFMRIETLGELGYHVWAPYHGRHIVSGDGRTIRSAVPLHSPARWQRLFFSQPLPLAAALQGLEVFHASAVAIRGRAIGFVAESGTGKTSTAAHLVAGGADFVTDDVLALEVADGDILAHPGSGRLAIDETELDGLEPTSRARLGAEAGRSDKLHLAVPTIPGPAPLGALYFLRREPSGRKVRIEESTGAATRALLASAFLRYLRSDDQLVKHLDVCSRIASSIATFRIAIPSSKGARDVATAVHRHLADVLEGEQ